MTRCWFSNLTYFYTSLIAPLGVMLVFNLVTVLVVTKNLHDKLSVSADYSKLKMVRIVGSLSLLVGITWILGALLSFIDSLVLQYAFAIFNSLQGFLIFYVNILTSNDIRSRIGDSVKSSVLQPIQITSFLTTSVSTAGSGSGARRTSALSQNSLVGNNSTVACLPSEGKQRKRSRFIPRFFVADEESSFPPDEGAPRATSTDGTSHGAGSTSSAGSVSLIDYDNCSTASLQADTASKPMPHVNNVPHTPAGSALTPTSNSARRSSTMSEIESPFSEQISQAASLLDTTSQDKGFRFVPNSQVAVTNVNVQPGSPTATLRMRQSSQAIELVPVVTHETFTSSRTREERIPDFWG